MNLGEAIFEAINEAVNNQAEQVNRTIRALNYAIASETQSWKLYDKLDADSKKIEASFKTYVLGVLRDDKEMRVKAIKSLKDLSEGIVKNAKSFKQFWNEHGKECAKKVKEGEKGCNHED